MILRVVYRPLDAQGWTKSIKTLASSAAKRRSTSWPWLLELCAKEIAGTFTSQSDAPGSTQVPPQAVLGGAGPGLNLLLFVS
jgi:hypothetical protein